MTIPEITILDTTGKIHNESFPVSGSGSEQNINKPHGREIRASESSMEGRIDAMLE